MSGPSKTISTPFALALVVIITACVYANSLSGDFVCDDRPMIVENDAITSWNHVPGYFTGGVWKSSELKRGDQALYRPLFLVNLFVNNMIWGPKPFGFHLTNLLLHIANSLLVFFVLRRLLRGVPVMHNNHGPLMGALVFGVHPVHAESVSWISGSTDLLVTLFFLSAFLLYARFKEDRRLFILGCSVALYLCALISKEVAVVLPVLILGYDLIMDRKILVKPLAVYGAATVGYLLVRSAALGKTSGLLAFSSSGLKHLIEFVAGYFKLLFVPWPLGFYLKVPESGIMGLGGLLAGGIALVILIGYARKEKIYAFAFLWLCITLTLPLLLAFHERPVFAERFLYLPSVGFVVILSGVIMDQMGKYKKSVFWALCLMITVFSALTVLENRTWKNDGAFYGRVVERNPAYSGGYIGLARHHKRNGEYDQAIDWYLKAMRHETGSYDAGRELAALYDTLGMNYGKKGLTEQSILYYTKELELLPGNTSALTGLGNNYFSRNEYQKALSYYLAALSSDSGNYQACYNVALAYEALGDRRHADKYYHLFISTAPAADFSETLERVRQKLAGLEKGH